MRRRHPLPRVWLMTDGRMGDALWAALERLPRGAGAVFRHYELAEAERRAVLAGVVRVARRRGLVVVTGEHRRPLPFVPSSVEGQVTRGVQGVSTALDTNGGGLERRPRPPLPGGGHHNRRPRHGLYSRSAHSRRDIVAAVRAGADLVFVSPVFATRSHPGAQALGRARFGLMIRGSRVPVIALGGMDARRARSLARLGIYGWAGIDAWLQPVGGGAK